MQVAVEILDSLPQSEAGNSYILVAGGYFTWWMKAYPIPNQEATSVAKKLVDSMFCRFSTPEQIHFNQGRQTKHKRYAKSCTSKRPFYVCTTSKTASGHYVWILKARGNKLQQLHSKKYKILYTRLMTEFVAECQGSYKGRKNCMIRKFTGGGSGFPLPPAWGSQQGCSAGLHLGSIICT